MPAKFCERSVNNQITRSPHFQAKIDIGQHASQTCIESARLLKNFTPREHTRARDSAAVSCHLQLAIRTRMFSGKSVKRGLRSVIDTHDCSRLFSRCTGVSNTGVMTLISGLETNPRDSLRIRSRSRAFARCRSNHSWYSLAAPERRRSRAGRWSFFQTVFASFSGRRYGASNISPIRRSGDFRRVCFCSFSNFNSRRYSLSLSNFSSNAAIWRCAPSNSESRI